MKKSNNLVKVPLRFGEPAARAKGDPIQLTPFHLVGIAAHR
jgi:hypothetical protein